MSFRRIWCFLAVLVTLAGPSTAWAQARPGGPKTKIKPLVTTIYIVRHAEKDTTGHLPDPSLTGVGQVRALALRRALLRRQPVALFTTDTRRTRATLAPLTEALKLEPQVYDPRRGRELAARILKEYAGKTVVVVGHSNTVLLLIDDFGTKPPVAEIADDAYDYLFRVRAAAGQMPTATVRSYGAKRKPEPKAKAAAKAMK